MQVSQSFRGFVQPFAEVIDMQVDTLNFPAFRNANVEFYFIEQEFNEDGSPIPFKQVLELEEFPSVPAWVEVWRDGFRLVNTSTDFGKTFEFYEVRRNRIFFKEDVIGRYKIICDRFFGLELPEANYIRINNEQGAKTPATKPGQALVAQLCEPVVVSEPRNGYVRLTDDRKSLVFVPDLDFEGYDSFSYVIMSERGQVSSPKCVYITVGKPGDKKDETPVVTPTPTPKTGG